jgi:iron complex transport system ATP-binding protein
MERHADAGVAAERAGLDLAERVADPAGGDQAPLGAITSWTSVPTASGDGSRTNMPYGETSCDTARTRLPSAIRSTGRFNATRSMRRRTRKAVARFHRSRHGLPCSSLCSSVATPSARVGLRSARTRLQSAAMAYLRLHDVAVALGGRDVVREVTAEVAAGELIVVVGPNGAGKTTLLRAIAGLIAPRTGTVRVLGRDPLRAPRRTIARELAYLPQQYELAFPFAVEEVVLLGRYARQHGLGLADADDLAAAAAAMAACDVAHLATRRFDELSGGEARRVIVAQALCQGARCLLLDEPTAGLDPLTVLDVRDMLADYGRDRAVLLSTHTLSEARLLCDRLVVLGSGSVVYDGPTATMLGVERAADSPEEAFRAAVLGIAKPSEDGDAP